MERLTLEEHQKIANYVKHINQEGREVYELLKKRFPNSHNPLNRFAQAINLLQLLKHDFQDACDSDRWHHAEDANEWRACYENIIGWTIIDDREED